MIIQGFQKRKIVEDSGYFFNAKINSPVSTGSFIFGFSGNNTLAINLISGHVYAADKKIYNYYPGEQLEIDGEIGFNTYDLFFNGNPVLIGQGRQTGMFHHVYLNADTATDFQITVNSLATPYEVETEGFYVSGQNIITGQISSNKRFNILSGSSPTSDYFNLSGFSTELANTQNFYIFKTTQDFIDYTFPITLNTSFGDIKLSYGITGFIPTQNILFAAFSPPNFNLNEETKNYTFQIVSTTGYQLGVSLLNLSGTGAIYGNIDVTGYYTGYVTGGLTGSGYIRTQLLLTGTGINSESDWVSGQFSGMAYSTFAYATGLQTGYFTLTGSGVGSGIGYTGLASGLFLYSPIFTINTGSGIYIFGTSQVTGVAINAFRTGTLSGLVPISNFSGRFAGTGTGSGLYIGTGLTGNNIPGEAYLIDYFKRFTGIWGLSTGINQFNLINYNPGRVFNQNIYSGELQMFPAPMRSIGISITHNSLSTGLDAAILIITGTFNQQIIITGNR